MLTQCTLHMKYRVSCYIIDLHIHHYVDNKMCYFHALSGLAEDVEGNVAGKTTSSLDVKNKIK